MHGPMNIKKCIVFLYMFASVKENIISQNMYACKYGETQTHKNLSPKQNHHKNTN
jgi:hypothetical protein